MTRKRLLAAAAGLAALALRPGLKAQQATASETLAADDESLSERVTAVDDRLASIERVLMEGMLTEDATPAAKALEQRLRRLEYRLQRIESKVMMMR